MKIANLQDFIKGWFVGSFEKSILKTKDFEVAVKTMKAGEIDAKHYHKIATEITVIVSGTAKMNNKEFSAGSVILLEPNEWSEFVAITDVTTVCVKTPSCDYNDKFTE